MKRILALGAALFASINTCQAAMMRLTADSPQPQPGDVLSLEVVPAPGERIDSVSMSALDTRQVKFYARGDGTFRGFVGYPFDRPGGAFNLRATVSLSRGGAPANQTVSTTVNGRARYYPTQRISMKSSTAGVMTQKGALAREKALVQSTMKSSAPHPLWGGGWLIPTSGVSTSSYGRRRYVNGKWWGQHNGADIKAGTGAPVVATNAGRVVLSRLLPTLRGNCIVVDHGCNVFSVYMHLSRRLVREGDAVRRGQLIGRVGATGFVTGPHLHWEMRIGWEPVDPFRIAARGLRF